VSGSVRAREPLLSAIVVTWNRPDLLRSCLDSLIRAGRDAAVELEVIVVDNGSTAGDPEMVEREFPEVILIRSGTNLGFARAVNLGFERAAGSLLLLVNNDVEVTGAALRQACELLTREPAVGIVGVRLVDAQGGPQISCAAFDTPAGLIAEALGLRALVRRRALEVSGDWGAVDYVSGAFFLIRRAVIDEIGPLDERFYFYTEEADWCLRARQAGWKTAHLPGVSVVHHHGATSSAQSARTSLWLLESRRRFVSKHYGKLWSAPIRLAALVCAGPLVLKGLALVARGRLPGQAAVVRTG